VPEELTRQVPSFLATVGSLRSPALVFLHTEVLDQHLLVEERAGRTELSALIDFADGRSGPPEYKFPAPVEFLFKGEAGLLREFLLTCGHEARELTPERSERILAFGLCHRYGRLLRMLRSVEPTRPATRPEWRALSAACPSGAVPRAALRLPVRHPAGAWGA
jgi:hygromycin-B 7''-O-kinase